MTAATIRTFGENGDGGLIRAALPSDRPAMLRIVEDRPAVADKLVDWPEWFSRSLVYVFEDSVVGFVTRGLPRHMIHGLYVAGDFRNRHFGTRLLHEVELVMEADGALLARLLVESSNPDARRLYLRLGYEDMGQQTPAGWMMERFFHGRPPLDQYPI